MKKLEMEKYKKTVKEIVDSSSLRPLSQEEQSRSIPIPILPKYESNNLWSKIEKVEELDMEGVEPLQVSVTPVLEEKINSLIKRIEKVELIMKELSTILVERLGIDTKVLVKVNEPIKEDGNWIWFNPNSFKEK